MNTAGLFSSVTRHAAKVIFPTFNAEMQDAEFKKQKTKKSLRLGVFALRKYSETKLDTSKVFNILLCFRIFFSESSSFGAA
jgi:hypothetical protein